MSSLDETDGLERCLALLNYRLAPRFHFFVEHRIQKK